MSDNVNVNHFLFVERYRPKKIEDCILPKRIKKTLQDIIKSGQIPNLLFTGPAGCGKTTAARALSEQLDTDLLFINASEDSGIDVLRTDIREFASKISLTHNGKIVILDEADYLNPNSTQPALRSFMEQFSNNCRFILTCNFPKKIIEPLHSRSTTIDFTLRKNELPVLATEFMNKIIYILKENNITYDNNVIAQFVLDRFKSSNPDYRKILNDIQKYSLNGFIDEGILVEKSDVELDELIQYLKQKKFNNVRNWVAKHSNDSTIIINKLYDSLSTYIDNSSIPIIVPLLAEYQYKAAFVTNQELNLMACLTYIMSDVKFK